MTPAPLMETAKRIALCLMIVAAAAAAPGCGLGGETTVPEELIGTWKTTAPTYADHVLRLSKTTIVFETAVKDGTAHPVERVVKAREQGTVLYTIAYEDAVDQEFSFYYEPAGGGTITLKNQREIQWKRES